MARLALDGVVSQKIHRKLLSIGSFHTSLECSLPCDMAVHLAKGVSVSALFYTFIDLFPFNPNAGPFPELRDCIFLLQCGTVIKQ